MKTKLIVTLLLVVFAAQLFAAGGTIPGSGTQQDPYLIEDLADFLAFAADSSYWDDYIKLDSDIDLAGQTFLEAPIAPDSDNSDGIFTGSEFSGTFDGSGHIISNLTIDVFQGSPLDENNDYLALFGCIEQFAKLKNIALENVNINAGSGSQNVAALCGKCNYLSYVTNCCSTGSITGHQYTTWVGGLLGLTQAVVNSSFSTVNVSGGNHLGGFCGENPVSGKIENCWASGSVQEINPSNPYSHTGGFCGRNSTGTSGYILNCYSTGSVTADPGDSTIGGFCGDDPYSTVSNCFWDTETSGMTTSPTATGKTTAEMKNIDTFKSNSWDFISTWQMNLGSYPKLKPIYYIPGDLNVDKAVNISDFSIFAEHWLNQSSL